MLSNKLVSREGQKLSRVAASMVSRNMSIQPLPYVPVFDGRFGPPGLRSASSGISATVFGAYGFLGRYVMNSLGTGGARAYVPFRGCELEVRHIKPMFDLGQLGLYPFHPRDEDSIKFAFPKSNVVINLVGKHYETKHLVPTRRENGQLSRINFDFEEVHVTIPRRIARLAKEQGVKVFIHVSALAANHNSSSEWARSKARGEDAVREEFPDAIIVRPANVFGPEDRFLNNIAEALSALPFFPLIDGGKAVFQPVYCNDIAKAILNLIHYHERFAGSTVNLAGPHEYTVKEIVEFVADVTTQQRSLVDVSSKSAMFLGSLVEQLNNPLLTSDGIKLMTEDNILPPVQTSSSEETPLVHFKDLGIEPVSLDRVAFDYLHRFRRGGHFTQVKGYY